MRKVFSLIIVLLLITGNNSNLLANPKTNYFTVDYNVILPYYTLRRIVNDRTGRGFSLAWENYRFKNFPLKISFQYNEWDKGITQYSDWNYSKVKFSKFSIGWIEISQKNRMGLYGVLSLSLTKWRIEKDGSLYKTTTKVYPDGEIGYIFKNNFFISIRGEGKLHLTKDILLNTFQISIGKRF